ncbi:MAG: MotA/TolQ/ExbB proton channel family protein [Bdellovibrionales bacterium]|nr:MotA/TolQ/ExbB proton channel family protein [Bdellovibrionales bacterium]
MIISWWQKVDRHVVGGIVLGLLFFAIAALLTGGIINFFSISALFVVLGGTVAATVVQFPPEVFQTAKQEYLDIIFPKEVPSFEARYRYLEKLSRLVKERGLVVLDQEASAARDPFLKLALELSSDRTSPEQIQRIMSHEMASSYQRGMQVVGMVESMASLAPAMGLVGTIIGLVNMFQSLGDISGVGQGLSVALLTTLYGAVLSHLLFAPLAGKLREKEEEKARLKRLTLEGILSLSQEENPILFEQRLRSFKSNISQNRAAS